MWGVVLCILGELGGAEPPPPLQTIQTTTNTKSFKPLYLSLLLVYGLIFCGGWVGGRKVLVKSRKNSHCKDYFVTAIIVKITITNNTKSRSIMYF